MQKLHTSNHIKNLGILAVTLGVAACTPVANNSMYGNIATPSHKHILSISSSDSQLKNDLTNLLNSPFVNVYPHYKDGGYNLTLTKRYSQSRALNKPQLFGVLRKEVRPTSFITKYNLSTFTGEIISQGEIISMGDDQTVIAPSLTYETNLTPSIIQDIANQLSPILEQSLYSKPWQAVVIAKKDYRHVIIQSSKHEGVNIGDMFTASNGSLLQIVTFENGQAVLTVLEGLVPDIGNKLTITENKKAPE